MPPGMMLRSQPWFIVRLWCWWLSLSGKERVEVVGIAVVAAYTTVAYAQLRALRRSTDAEVATVRAWVYPVDVKPPPPAEIQLNGKFPIEFRNGGKTPALELLLTEEFKYWDRAAGEPMPKFLECTGLIRNKAVYKFGAIDTDGTRWLEVPTIDAQLTKDQSAKLVSLQGALLVHLCLEYQTVSAEQKGLTEYCTVAYGADLKSTAPCLSTSLKLR